MPRILGKITERLLKQHGSDSPGWNPARPADHGTPKGGKVPDSAAGYPVGRGAGRRKGGANRTIAVVLALATVFVLGGCYEGTITDKRGCTDGKPCEVLVVERDQDGDVVRERWVEVDESVFNACDNNEWFEDGTCGPASGMRNIPAPEGDTDGYRNPRRDSQDQNNREVCFAWTIDNSVYMYAMIRINDKVVYDKKQQWIDGPHERCYYAAPASVVSLSLGLSGKDQDWPTMSCKITQTTGRGLRVVSHMPPLATNSQYCRGMIE